VAQKTFSYRYKAKEIGIDSFSPFVLELKSTDGGTVLKKGNEVEIEVVGYFKRYFIVCLCILILAVMVLSLVIAVRTIREAKARGVAAQRAEGNANVRRGLEEEVLRDLEDARSRLIAGDAVQYLREVMKIVKEYTVEASLTDVEWKKNMDVLDDTINDIAYAGKAATEEEIRTLIRRFEVFIKKNIQEDE